PILDSPPNTHGLRMRTAIVVAVVSALVTIVALYEVVKGDISAGSKRFFALVAILAFAGLIYGTTQALLALVATTAERRRLEREVSERRTGDRARKPKK
ncbi:MAG TPA: hypothetical protein VNJ04_12570, partial [Gemmatimonadaceae bacterium]|nr:hypothetical protein [Gemmatimonadaceae bacterium]